MKRILTITAVTALTIGVSVPAAALPTLSDGLAITAAPSAQPQEFVAAASVASPVVRDAFGVEIIPKPAPVAQTSSYSSSYSGGYGGSFAGTLSVWPAGGNVNDGFGYRDGGEFHKGIDIMAGYGSTIVAASPGVVTKVAWDGGWGRYIVVDHGDGISTLYSHAIDGSQMVSAGQTVDAGTPLALVGDTGYVTVAHLHFEVHVGGSAVDPMPWMP